MFLLVLSSMPFRRVSNVWLYLLFYYILLYYDYFILTILTLSLIFNFLYDLRNLWMAMCIHLSWYNPLSFVTFLFLLLFLTFLLFVSVKWILHDFLFFKLSSTWTFLFFFSSLSFISLSFYYFSLPLYLSYISPPILISLLTWRIS